MLAGLPYVLWPVGSVFILATRKKDDPYLHYHAIQGLIWGAVALGLSVAGFLALLLLFRVMPGSSTYLPGVLGMGLLFGGGVIAMIVFFTAIFLAWRATAGEMLRLPFAGDFAEQRMLDHTGMTRREFVQMLENSFIEPNFDEPEPIPFPDQLAPTLNARAQEILAQRATRDATPASVKAVDLMAQRQAQQAQAKADEAKAKAEEARRQAALAQQQRAAALQAQQAAVLQASQRAPGVAQPGADRRPSQPSVAAAPGQAQSPASPARPETGRAKSYSLIGDKVSTPSTQPGPGHPSTSQARPPQPSASQARPPQPPAPQARPAQSAPAQPKVKDVDLVRHYKERGKAPSSSDALKGWLTSVDPE